MFLDRSIDLFTGGKVYDLCLKSVGVNAEPFGLGTSATGLNNGLDLLGSAALFTDCNNISCLYQVGRNVNLFAVYGIVVVNNQLTGFGTGRCPTAAVNHVVETAFKQTEQVFTGNAGLALCYFKIMVELAFQNTVISSCFLLHAQLKTVFRNLLAALSVLTGGITTTVEGAFA